MERSELDKNKSRFGPIYRKTDVDEIVHKVRHHSDFLEYARITDTSWVGLYWGDFRNRLRGTKVLELGAGDGLNALIMASLGAQVFAIDIVPESPKIIDQASRALGLQDHVEAVEGDFLQLPLLADSFDYVVGKAFLHHLTHESEDLYLRKVANLLHQTGEARFVEPAINSKLLDTIRWLVPAPGRPSKLSHRAFAEWKSLDAHPERDNSSAHFERIGFKYFNQVEITPIGGVERFHRILPLGHFRRPFRRLAFRFEKWIPYKVNFTIARSQTLVFRGPRAP